MPWLLGRRSPMGCLLALLLVLGAGAPAWAAARVWVVGAQTSAAHQEAAQAMAARLERAGVARTEWAEITPAQAADAEVPPPASGLRVALGVDACARQALQPGPLLCALIPKAAFERVQQQAGRRAQPLAAVVLDQPLGRQLSLIQAALPQASRIGVLWGPESLPRAAALRISAQQRGLTLVEATAAADAVFPALKQALDADVLLAMADPVVYNSQTLPNVLLAALRARVAVVGFSPAYAKAGALLALYATPQQVGTQAGQIALAWLRGGALPTAAVEPQEFEVAVNDHVARSLGYSLQASRLQQAIQRMEAAP